MEYLVQRIAEKAEQEETITTKELTIKTLQKNRKRAEGTSKNDGISLKKNQSQYLCALN